MRATATDAPRASIVLPVVAFVLLTVVWGSSYFLTELALESFRPIQITAFRFAIATVVLGVVVVALRLRFPRRFRVYVIAGVLGLFGIAVPIVLVAEAQRHVGASLATVLVATTPIFVFLISVVRGRVRLGAGTVAGIGLAFTGVAVLSWVAGGAGGGSPGWLLLIVVCSAMFAAGNVAMADVLGGMSLMMLVFLELGVAAVVLLAIVGVGVGLPAAPPTPLAVAGVLGLGVLGSALAYVLFSYLLRVWGSTPTSINTYLQPLVGLLLGAAVLRESISVAAWLAVGVTLGGVLLFAFASVRQTRRREVPPIASP